MRVVLVGPADARRRLRALLSEGFVIAGEAPTLEAARESAFDADGWLIVPDRPVDRIGEPDAPGMIEPLTPREAEVLDLIAQGLPNKAIAGRLAISDQTVKFHVASICGKLGAANRTDAVRRAARTGLITL
jgi:DNA-binding NarL/FixJ family response regulator